MGIQKNKNKKLISTINYSSEAEEQLFNTIISAVQDKKANQIISLDLRDIEEAVADFFIICDVQTGVQMSAVAENVEKMVREQLGEKPFQFEMGPTWTLVDYINIVVHIFQTDERKFYDLEGLWMDAPLEHHDLEH